MPYIKLFLLKTLTTTTRQPPHLKMRWKICPHAPFALRCSPAWDGAAPPPKPLHIKNCMKLKIYLTPLTYWGKGGEKTMGFSKNWETRAVSKHQKTNRQRLPLPSRVQGNHKKKKKYMTLAWVQMNLHWGFDPFSKEASDAMTLPLEILCDQKLPPPRDRLSQVPCWAQPLSILSSRFFQSEDLTGSGAGPLAMAILPWPLPPCAV